MTMTPEQRRERARKAANSRWARPTALAEQADTMRSATWAYWERQVDPEQRLDPAERRKLAQHAVSAHMAGLRLTQLQQGTPQGWRRPG